VTDGTVCGCRFLLQLNKEQKLANECDTKAPFDGQRDILRRLAVFHVFQTRDEDPEQVEQGGAGFDDLFVSWSIMVSPFNLELSHCSSVR